MEKYTRDVHLNIENLGESQKYPPKNKKSMILRKKIFIIKFKRYNIIYKQKTKWQMIYKAK